MFLKDYFRDPSASELPGVLMVKIKQKKIWMKNTGMDLELPELLFWEINKKKNQKIKQNKKP